jgi:hypothetical protein
MPPRTRSRPRLDILEGRDAPAVLTVTFSAATRTLTVLGTDTANQLTIAGDGFDPTAFTLTSTTDEFADGATVLRRSGVHHITLRLLGGDDDVTLTPGPPIRLVGGLTVNGGDGANRLVGRDLTVGKGLTIRNGTNTAGNDLTFLENLDVGGAVTVTNGDGDAVTYFARTRAGLSTVRGSVSITNGTGLDFNTLGDLNVGGNVTVRNGRADGNGDAGNTRLVSRGNLFRSAVRGGVSFSNLDGNGTQEVRDADVGGSVSLALGSGSFTTNLDGDVTRLPAHIHGSLSVTGSGANVLNIGAGDPFNGPGTGLIVRRNLTVTFGGGEDSIHVNRLQVGGAARLSLGAGTSTVAIDDSHFGGTFTLTTGAGPDTLNVDTRTGSGGETRFEKAFLARQGSGFNATVLGGTSDGNQAVVFLSTAVVHRGATGSLTKHQVNFPFGGEFEWIE